MGVSLLISMSGPSSELGLKLAPAPLAQILMLTITQCSLLLFPSVSFPPVYMWCSPKHSQTTFGNLDYEK